MARSSELSKLLDEYEEYLLSTNPILATILGDHRFNSELGDHSMAALDVQMAKCHEFHEKLITIDRSGYDEDDALTNNIFKKSLENSKRGFDLNTHLLCVDHLSGPQMIIPHICQVHPTRNRGDLDDFHSRMKQVPKYLNDIKEYLRTGLRVKIVSPAFSIEQTIAQFNDLSTGDATPLMLPVTGNNSDFQGRQGLVSDIESAINGVVRPALGEFAEFLRSEYMPKCAVKPGLCNLASGPEIYNFLIEQHTSPAFNPWGIHRIGEEEVAKTKSQMLDIMSNIGFKGDQQEFFKYLRTDKKFMASSREEYLSYFNRILDEMKKRIPDFFATLPKYPCEVRPMEPFREKNAPTAYYMPVPIDGSRPGIYYVNTSNWETRSTYTLEALSYHEAAPGHHFQISLSRELKNLPLVRKLAHYTAYIEGWALYSELLAKEMGFYQDPYSDFGRLTFDAWRSSRLVIDTGIHHYGWSREKAMDYLRESTSLCEADIVAEIDRYCVMVGQACSYKIGQLHFLKIRDEAVNRLKENFSIREFHDEVLLSGALPLDILEGRVRRWIDGKSRGPADETN